MVPAIPRRPSEAKVARPRTAVAVVAPMSCPPAPEVIATVTVEVLRRTRLLWASLIEI